MIAFTTTTLAPDMPQIAAWLLTEGLAWFQSASSIQLACGVWSAFGGLAGVLLLVGRRLK